MRFFQSVRTRMIAFSVFVSFLVLVLVGLGYVSIIRIRKSADHLHMVCLPILKSANNANLALKEGDEIRHHAELDVIEPADFDKVRKYASRFKMTMINFDMYIKALTWGSESEIFRRSSGVGKKRA